jgi:hypothetical protein
VLFKLSYNKGLAHSNKTKEKYYEGLKHIKHKINFNNLISMNDKKKYNILWNFINK